MRWGDMSKTVVFYTMAEHGFLANIGHERTLSVETCESHVSTINHIFVGYWYERYDVFRESVPDFIRTVARMELCKNGFVFCHNLHNG